jgi:hypothetical protein
MWKGRLIMGNRNLLSVFAVATSFLVGCVAEVGDEGAPAEEQVVQRSTAKLEGLLLGQGLGGRKLAPQEGILAPAPGITSFEVYAVASAATGAWEYVSPSQFITSSDHGGAWIDVAVLQYGYDNNNGATLSGSTGSNYAEQLLCGSLATIHLCSAGETVTGFMTYYEFLNKSGGSFSAYADSIANPFGRKTDSITIR